MRKRAVCREVRPFNIPSYLHARDVTLDAGLGPVVDLAYGGNYYAIIEPQEIGPASTGCLLMRAVEPACPRSPRSASNNP